MKHFRRHNFIWHLLHPIIRLLAFIKFNYRTETRAFPAPCVIVSNHVTNWDPLLLALSLRNHAYFVGSDHVVSNGFVGRLLEWLQAPIARRKGVTAGDTALAMIRRLRKGYSVALFPEGNRCYNGRTGAIVPSTAKLIKMSGAGLVTHRFLGGYLTSPRWAGDASHRGYMRGEFVRYLTAEEVKALTVQQIGDILREDLYEDAYVTQEDWQIPYRSRRRAEHLERALYMCPRCERLDTLRSKGSRLTCTACGLTAEYTELGYLEGKDVPWHTVIMWDLWQAGKLRQRADAAGPDDILARDDRIDIERLDDLGRRIPLGSGELRITRTALTFGEIKIPLASHPGIGLVGPQVMLVTDEHMTRYRLSSGEIRCMRKYLTIFHAVTDPEKLMDI